MHSSAELLTLFVGVAFAFCCENPTGQDLLTDNSRKPAGVDENNVYYTSKVEFQDKS